MKKALIGALALLVGGLIWLGLREEAPAPAGVGVSPGAGAAARAEAATAPHEAERREVEVLAVAPAPTVTLKGRCVDAATRAPLAGCTVTVRGGAGNGLEEYVKRRGKIDWQAPADQTTGPDGTFAFTFVPPPPYQFTLDIHAAELVPASGRWNQLQPGTVLDFGDVALARGSRVSGRVADSNGIPQGGVEVFLDQYQQRPRDDGVSARRWHRALSKADGTFAFADPVSSGAWNLQLRGRRKVAPASLEVFDGQASTTLWIETVPLGEIESISGIVFDDAGARLPGVRVTRVPGGGGSGRTLRTEDDGAFAIERGETDSDGPVQLQLDLDGYERLLTEKRYPWGAADLNLVLRRALAVDVVVTDGDTGEPIEDYAVRCFPDPGAPGPQRAGNSGLRNQGPHPDGKTTIEGVARGPSVLVIESTTEDWQSSDLLRLDVTEGTPTQAVKLRRAVNQTLHVQRSNGDPIAGTTVELLEPIGAVTVNLMTYAEERFGTASPRSAAQAVLLTKGQTSASGELLLSGPPERTLALRLLGPGHQAWCDPAVTLVEGSPLIVTVATGATVVGVVGPAELMAWLQQAPYKPSVFLERNLQGRPERFPSSGFFGIPVGEDGTLRIEDVPPGTWSVLFHYVNPGGGSLRSALLQTLPGLAEGEVRELSANLAHLLPGRVSGTVLLHGEPLAQARLQLLGRRPEGQSGEPLIQGPVLTTGAGGTFSVQAEPAQYRLQVSLPRGPTGAACHLPAEESITLASGQELEQVFHVRRGALRVRVLRTDGQPVPGMVVTVSNLDQSWSARTPKTDADGWTAIEASPAGPVALTAIPKRLLDPAGAQAFLLANGPSREAILSAMLQLGRVEIAAGTEPSVVEVKLPVTSEY